jgi:hypothetical protein
VPDVLEDLELIVLVDDFEAQCCESVLHQEWRLPPHEAMWWASAPCLSLMAVCDDRRRKCLRDGAWRCTPQQYGGCSAVHEYHEIEWTPVRVR